MRRYRSALTGMLAGCLLLSGGPALAGSFGPVTVLNTPTAGSHPRIVDLGGLGTPLAVAWVTDVGALRSFALRVSFDRGTTWDGLATPSGYQAPRMSHCPGLQIVFAWTTKPGPDRQVGVGDFGDEGTIAEAGSDVTRPDVVCLDASLAAVVTLITRNGATRLHLYLFDRADFVTPLAAVDLGPANKGSTPSIDATPDRIGVAWTDGTRLRFKRFGVVRAVADVTLTPRPTKTIETTTSQGLPRLAMDGDRVVLAWERKGDVVARVSHDQGATFGPRATLFDGSPQTGSVATLTNADVLGSTIVVSGTVVSEGITARGSIRRSTDNGRTWGAIKGSAKRGGLVFGALAGSRADPSVLLAWDEQIAAPAKQRVRAQFAP